MKLFLIPLALSGIFSIGLAMGPSIEEFPLIDPATVKPGAVEEIVYRNTNLDDRGFNRAARNVCVPTLTVFHPAGGINGGAAVVVCPGGGYQYVTIDREGAVLGRYFSARGITVAVLKYRLPNPAAGDRGLPYPQQDAIAAMALMRSHAKEWGIGAKRIGMLGASAGGHLAGSLGILEAVPVESRPDFVALLYPVVCMDGPYVNAGSRDALLGPSASEARREAFSLEKQIRPGLPPFFVAHAKDDRAVPYQNSELLVAALHARHVPAELLLVETGGHGFGLGRDAESARWTKAFLSWLNRLP
jgi:acetyl esterase/lipase